MDKKEKEGKVIITFSIMWVFVAVIIIASIVAFFQNYIFASNERVEEENIPVLYEENAKAVDVLEIMVENTSENKKLVNEVRDIAYETKYENTENLPKDEKQTKQEGKVGKLKVTALQEYQNEEMVNEEIIESEVQEEAIEEIIYVGTSEFLQKYKVHIGDTVYLVEPGELKKEQDATSETITNISRYLNLTLKEMSGEWAKVTYGDKEGYIKLDKLTSEYVNPKIVEQNRIQKLKETLKEDMPLNKVSGLTLSDYKTIFANEKNDKRNVFKDNAENFYNAEQKYKINGIFLASIGIHESAWGTSTLAVQKHNLFGFSAYDRDPINSAANFNDYSEAIDGVAKALAKNYLYPSGTKITDGIIATGSYYNGTSFEAVNKRYASDQNWHTKVYSYMQYLYNKL